MFSIISKLLVCLFALCVQYNWARLGFLTHMDVEMDMTLPLAITDDIIPSHMVHRHLSPYNSQINKAPHNDFAQNFQGHGPIFITLSSIEK